jgi:hypothetical protein
MTMTDPIHVPDIPGPRRQLCWQQGPTMARCDQARLARRMAETSADRAEAEADRSGRVA